MPLIFANYGRGLNFEKVEFTGGYVESLPGLLTINRLSLPHRETIAVEGLIVGKKIQFGRLSRYGKMTEESRL